MSEVLLDIPKLTNRIKELASTYKPNETTQSVNRKDDVLEALRPVIQKTIVKSMLNNDIYWKQNGLRVVDKNEFAACLEKINKKGKILGEGYYGKVYDVKSNECIKNIPKGVKHVGVKIELIKKEYDPHQQPNRLREVIAIAKKAAKLGIGPNLYDVFITHDLNGDAQIVKVFEIIDGKSWENTIWKNPKQKKDAVDKLDAAIRTMNQAGIIHHDLHAGNVMLDKKGMVYIIDYDRAKLVINEEHGILKEFNTTLPWEWEPTGAASKEGIEFVYDTLVSEGAIKITNEGNVKIKKERKTRKANRRRLF